MAKRISYEENVGNRFGKLTLISFSRGSRNRKLGTCVKPKYTALCECGNKTTPDAYSVIRGLTRSCGCVRDEIFKTTHGMCGSELYDTWANMRKRCLNENDPAYENYGGRGISICKSWDDFSKFARDIGERPDHNYTIERIDNNGNYEPSNCRWATRIEQANNTRRCIEQKTRLCPNCHRLFEADKSGRRYCSRDCGYIYRRGDYKGKHVSITCASCKNEFLPANRDRKYCSRGCFYKRKP